MVDSDDSELHKKIRDKYARAATQVRQGRAAASGVAPSTLAASGDPIGSNLYSLRQVSELPPSAFQASLGCGNPTALARLNPGEVVLDLGSGGGIDVLIAAKQVGSTGRVYGLDMTEEMILLARENQRQAGATNVEFLLGLIEAIPLPDESVDVVISNAAVNLAPDKDRVLREAFRVLRPGGRLAVSDVVTKGELAPAVRQGVLVWLGCIGGALSEDDYAAKLAIAGFGEIAITPTRIYEIEEEARAFLTSAGIDAVAADIQQKFRSVFIRAVKPPVAAIAAGLVTGVSG